MSITKINDNFAVSPQLVPSDLPEVAAKGYKAVICNRPDHEGPDQPDFATIQDAATAAGLEIRYIPIVPGQMTMDDLQAFKAALDGLPGPILAYCRSGARSTATYDAVMSQLA